LSANNQRKKERKRRTALTDADLPSSYAMSCFLSGLKRKGVCEQLSKRRLKPLSPVLPFDERSCRSREAGTVSACSEERTGKMGTVKEKEGKKTHPVRDQVLVLPLPRVRRRRGPAHIRRRSVRVSRRSFRDDRIPLLVEVGSPLVVD
jgi:hypothetical protein